jgi:hypothetical protein
LAQAATASATNANGAAGLLLVELGARRNQLYRVAKAAKRQRASKFKRLPTWQPLPPQTRGREVHARDLVELTRTGLKAPGAGIDLADMIERQLATLTAVMHRQERTLLLDPEADVQRPVHCGVSGLHGS